ncbi:MAG: hypothetical protein KQH53_11530 [Desulfarculaceae bacterium]|nr:hypothetical protein [Desulfarculaceae bacterium]
MKGQPLRRLNSSPQSTRRTAALAAALLLLCALGGCATDQWCNKLNDYSTLDTDQDYCRNKAGVLGSVLPVRYNDCMKSLGWYPCDEKPEPNETP